LTTRRWTKTIPAPSNSSAASIPATPKPSLKASRVLTRLYVNPETNQFWLLDYRLFDKDGDGKSKPGHAARDV
jgi:hypothetical protein